ncbi:MAG: lipopolysaccharide heptosyltransferase II [Verrucomicrobiota bacterium]|jgi:heptosyltransferase-2
MNPSAPHDATAPANENILVRGVNWLGDAVLSVPALQRLRQAKPGARITLLAPEKLAGLWQGQPFLDDLLLFSPGDNLWQTARRLRARHFSAAIAFPNSLRSALELWLAAIPQRAGYARPGRTLFLTNPVPPRAGAAPMRKRSSGEIRQLLAGAQTAPPLPPSAHHLHDYLRLVAALGASAEPLPPRITISQEEAEKTAALLGLPAPRTDRPFLGLNPGAAYGPAKRWPAESFIAAGIALHRATRCLWIIFGGPSDRDIAHFISTGLGRQLPGQPVINLAGQTTLRELAAALKSCRLLLTNDTGPMHLAAAVGTPVVVPYGSTSPELTGPVWSSGAEILRAPGIPCSPCFRRECPIDFRCMKGIAPEAVVAAALRALNFKP